MQALKTICVEVIGLGNLFFLYTKDILKYDPFI